MSFVKLEATTSVSRSERRAKVELDGLFVDHVQSERLGDSYSGSYPYDQSIHLPTQSTTSGEHERTRDANTDPTLYQK